MESAYYSNVFNGKVKNHLLKEKHRASVTSMSDVESFSGLDDEEKRQSMPGRQTNKCENIFEEDFIDGFAIMSFKSLNDLKVVVSAKSRRQLPVKDGSDSGHVLDGAMLGNRVKEKERKPNKTPVSTSLLTPYKDRTPLDFDDQGKIYHVVSTSIRPIPISIRTLSRPPSSDQFTETSVSSSELLSVVTIPQSRLVNHVRPVLASSSSPFSSAPLSVCGVIPTVTVSPTANLSTPVATVTAHIGTTLTSSTSLCPVPPFLSVNTPPYILSSTLPSTFPLCSALPPSAHPPSASQKNIPTAAAIPIRRPTPGSPLIPNPSSAICSVPGRHNQIQLSIAAPSPLQRSHTRPSASNFPVLNAEEHRRHQPYNCHFPSNNCGSHRDLDREDPSSDCLRSLREPKSARFGLFYSDYSQFQAEASVDLGAAIHSRCAVSVPISKPAWLREQLAGPFFTNPTTSFANLASSLRYPTQYFSTPGYPLDASRNPNLTPHLHPFSSHLHVQLRNAGVIAATQSMTGHSQALFVPSAQRAPPYLTAPVPLPSRGLVSSLGSFEPFPGQDFLQQDLNNRLLAHQVPPVQSLFGHPQLDIAGLPGQSHPHFLGQRMQHRAYEGLTPIVSTSQPLMFDKIPKSPFVPGPRVTSVSNLGPVPGRLPETGYLEKMMLPGIPQEPSKVSVPAIPLPDQLSPHAKAPGRWCAMHVRIAWEIYRHQHQQHGDMGRGGSFGKLPDSGTGGWGCGDGTGSSGYSFPHDALLLAAPSHAAAPSPALMASGLTTFPRPPIHPSAHGYGFGGHGSSFGQDAGSARACASLTYGWDRFPNVPPSFAVWPDTDRDVDKARGAESERCGRKDGGPGRERSAGKEVECDRLSQDKGHEDRGHTKDTERLSHPISSRSRSPLRSAHLDHGKAEEAAGADRCVIDKPVTSTRCRNDRPDAADLLAAESERQSLVLQNLYLTHPTHTFPHHAFPAPAAPSHLSIGLGLMDWTRGAQYLPYPDTSGAHRSTWNTGMSHFDRVEKDRIAISSRLPTGIVNLLEQEQLLAKEHFFRGKREADLLRQYAERLPTYDRERLALDELRPDAFASPSFGIFNGLPLPMLDRIAADLKFGGGQVPFSYGAHPLPMPPIGLPASTRCSGGDGSPPSGKVMGYRAADSTSDLKERLERGSSDSDNTHSVR